MTSARPTPINDDHGDQFPGAVPAVATAAPTSGADERLVRMHAAYVQKVNSVVEAGREGLAHELAHAFAEESAEARVTEPHGESGRRTAGRRTPGRGPDGRRPGRPTTRLGRITRSSLDRFDRYTLEVFNAGSPYRSLDERSA
jgi:hypothetical protein